MTSPLCPPLRSPALTSTTPSSSTSPSASVSASEDPFASPPQHLRGHRLPRRHLRDPVTVVLFHLPPILISAVSAVYYVLSIKSFYRSCSQFQLLLSTSAHANLNLNRYVRLMALVSIDLLLTVPLAAFVLYSNVAIIGLSPWPWVSWADTHSNFSRVVQVPGIYWRADPYSAASLETLSYQNYRCAFQAVAKPMGYTTAGSGMGLTGCVCLFLLYLLLSFTDPPSLSATSKYHLSSHGSSHGASATLPVFIRKETTQKRDSFDSFSALYGGISPLRYDAEKAETLEDGDAHALTLGDVSGMLPDYKESDCSSSAPSSSSSAPSASSVHSEEEEGEAEEIEVSYLHRASVHITLCPPEPAHVRRPSADVPMPVVVRDVANIV
ncbi:pheromone A receptor-domain-containing protein [Mycena leptocephala]|nr:pheromone A receptor-domain-containing protein [Mycena leptocephala]